MLTSNHIRKGEKLEKKISKDFHKKGIPVLISSKLLRKMDLGQIDLARMVKRSDKNFHLEILEVKNSNFITPGQHSRLKRSANFLSKLFKCLVTINFYFKD